jgi:release factor glutamine methyltransferase
MKLDFYVDKNVLIPRADTEILVEEVINNCNNNAERNYNILDLCAGSGAIGISIAKYVKTSKITEVDISNEALNIAMKNAKLNEVANIEFLQSNMFKNINKKFDIIVSNPPYIKKDVIAKLDYEVQKEPKLALDGGEDGLKFYRIIIDEADKYLTKNGMIFLEIGYDQKEDVIKLLEKSGKYKDIYSKKDLYNNDRIVVASVI